MVADSPRRKRAASLVLVLTFLAGGATGAGLFASLTRHGPPPHGPGRLPPPFEQLDLQPEQRRQVEAVFEKHRGRFEALLDERRPKLEALRDAMDAELMPMLTDAQRVRFEALKKDHPQLPPGFGPP